MCIYLTTFALSFALYEIGIRLKKKTLSNLFLLLCIVVPALLAGLRDPLVGKDFSVYGTFAWEGAVHSNSFLEYIKDPSSVVGDLEIGYLFFNYILSRFFSDFHAFFFFHQFLLMGLVVFLAYRFRSTRYSGFILLFYFFSLYNQSLNLLRQSIAISIALIALAELVKGNKKNFWIIFLVTCLFHRSAYFFVFVYIFPRLLEEFRKKEKLLVFVVMVAFAVGYTFFTPIMNFLIFNGVYSDHYSAYVGMVGFKTHKIDIGMLVGIECCLLLIVKNKLLEARLACLIAFVAVLFHLFGGLVEIAARIALYYDMSLSVLLIVCSTSRKDSQKLLIGCSILLLMRWLYLAINGGMDWTIPYTSKLLGI